MFRHQNAIFTESMNTEDHKSNTPLQVLNALTVIFKILKCYNSRVQKVDKYKPTLLWHQKYTIVSFFQNKLTAIYVILWNTYTNICHNVCMYVCTLDCKYRSSGECIISVNAIQSSSENIAWYFVCTYQSYDNPVNNMILPWLFKKDTQLSD